MKGKYIILAAFLPVALLLGSFPFLARGNVSIFKGIIDIIVAYMGFCFFSFVIFKLVKAYNEGKFSIGADDIFDGAEEPEQLSDADVFFLIIFGTLYTITALFVLVSN